MFVVPWMIAGAIIGLLMFGAYASGMSKATPAPTYTKAMRGVIARPMPRSRPVPRRRTVPVVPVTPAPDRSELIATLRGLGYRAGDARSIAESVPANITKTEGAIAWVLSNTRRG